MTSYHPDFTRCCRECGASPCVVVDGHSKPNTKLCGVCFFGSETMANWDNWNDEPELTE